MSNKYKDVPVEDTKLRFRPNMATDAVIFALFDTDDTNKNFILANSYTASKERLYKAKVSEKGKQDLI